MIEAHTTLSEPYSLVLRKLCNEYVAGKPVLKEIDLTIEGRGITAIIGPSGTGKSTVLGLIAGIVVVA